MNISLRTDVIPFLKYGGGYGVLSLIGAVAVSFTVAGALQDSIALRTEGAVAQATVVNLETRRTSGSANTRYYVTVVVSGGGRVRESVSRSLYSRLQLGQKIDVRVAGTSVEIEPGNASHEAHMRLLAAVTLALVGVILIHVTRYWLKSARLIRAKCCATEAVVTRIETIGGKSRQVHITVSFTDRLGTTHVIQPFLPFGDRHDLPEVGDIMTVYYDPDMPTNMELFSFGRTLDRLAPLPLDSAEHRA